MTEEKKEATTDENATEKPKVETTEETVSQETEETASEETKVDVLAELQKDRSKRGREMKDLRDEVASMKDLLTAVTQQTTENPTEKYVTTEADVVKVFNNEKNKDVRVAKDYDTKYVSSLDGLGELEGLNDEEIKEVGILLNSKYKQPFSGYSDPISDADRNFYRALADFRRGDKKTPNLKGDTPKGTSVKTTTKVVEKEAEAPKLDEFAQGFVDYHKIDDKSVAKTLKRATPGGLVNKTAEKIKEG